MAFKHYLKYWTLSFVENGTLVNWTRDQFLHLPIHELQATNQGGESIEVLLNEVIDGKWTFRRNLMVSSPLEQTIGISPLGIRILCPQIVLLYKAKSNLAKDRADLQAVLPSLQRDTTRWLKQAIEKTHGKHPWIAELQRFA
jgi:hypothetical protein